MRYNVDMFVRIPPAWEIPERLATPEQVYLNRRQFLKTGAVLAGAAAIASAAVTRNPRYTLDRPLSDESVATRYNNYYEFTLQKDMVWRLAERFRTRPWQIEVAGLVEKKLKLDVDELIRQMPVEERLYRHRCVEAWAMAVPWTGFPMKGFLDFVKPLSRARFVRMVSFHRPNETPGVVSQPHYPWPYFEGLTMAEASHELAFLVTGMYGHDLPRQNGAPIRLVTPWKYGFKSIKGIVKFEFTARQPDNFWHVAVPDEYDFWANVNPKARHPRWSQATETMIGTGEKRPTQLYNGYGQYVAGLYTRGS